MKAIKLLLFTVSFCALQVVAQNNNTATGALVGTWMETTDTLREIKIISPTHVFFMVLNRDSFLYAGAGTYTIDGNKYTEHLQYANFAVDSMKGFTFDYNVDGDKFMQKGTLTMPDNTEAQINHTFTRVKPDMPYDGPHVGTWNQLSSSYTDENGNKASHTNATHIRFQIVTPTHWMRISTANNKFENAFGGTYIIDGGKMKFKVDYASDPALIGVTAELTQRFEGNKNYWAGIVKDTSDKQINQIEDVFERVEVK